MILRRIAMACLALCLLCGAVGAQQPPVPTMALGQVRAGMTGYGLSHFSGAAPQPFDVEVLGVARWFPKSGMILVRMSGPVVDEAGIIAGMSGSPVYVDGKLLGAVAYGFPFSKIPLAGLTPAEDMLALREIEEDGGFAPPARADARRRLTERSRALAEALARVQRGESARQALRPLAAQMAMPAMLARPDGGPALGPMPEAALRMLPPGADGQLRPLPIPVATAGGVRGGQSLAPLLAAAGFMPVGGPGGGAADATEEVPVEPGISVGTPFVSGDLDLAGVGTLTWVEGDEALAFGHPMFGAGQVDLPLAVGRVQAIVPSLQRSFKIASTGRVIGRITQDREPAVLARLGERAPTFPCKVRVRGAVEEEFDYRVTGFWQVAPMFTLYALQFSTLRWEGTGNRYTLTARACISLDGHDEPLVLENVYTSYSAFSPAFDLVLMPMVMLLLNPYREVEIAGVDYDVDVKPGFEAALIESAWTDRTRAKPGEDVTVYVRLQQFRGDEEVMKLTLTIPQTAQPESRVQIIVCDAMTNRMIKAGLDPGFFAPRSFDDLLRMLREMEPNRNLVMRASVMERGVRYAGQAMPSLPPSALSLLHYDGEGGRTEPLVTDVVLSAPTPYVLEGQQSVFVTVEKPEPYERAAGPGARPRAEDRP